MVSYPGIVNLLFVSLVLMLFGHWGYKKGRDPIVKRWFLLLSLFVSIWYSVTNLPTVIAINDYAAVYYRADLFLRALLSFFVFIFFLNFPVSYRDFSLKRIFLFATPSIFIALSVLATDLVVNNINVVDGVLYFSQGPFYYLYYAVLLGYLAGAIYLLWIKYRRLTEIRQVQVKYVLIGLIVHSILISIARITSNSSGQSDLWDILIYSPLILWFFLTYTIVTFRFVDIRLVIKKGGIFVFALGTILILISLVQYFIRYFFYLESQNINIIIGLVGVILAILLFSPIKSFFSILASEYLFPSMYNSKELISQMSDNMQKSLLANEIYAYITKTLQDVFQSTSVGILLYDKQRKVYKVQVSYGFEIGGRKEFKGDLVMKKAFIEKNDAIIIDEVIASGSYEESRNSLGFWSQLGVKVIAPLNVGKETIGLVVIGKKKNREMYNSEDALVLKIIGSQAAIIIKNALLFKDVKDFNRKLQGEVQKATKKMRVTNEKLAISNEQFELANEELKRLDDVKSQFISMASHQLRTPISITRGYASMLIDGDFGGLKGDQPKYLKKIDNSLVRLNNIVNDILNASRMEGNRISVHKTKTRIDELVKNVFEQLESSAKAKKLGYMLQIDPKLDGRKINIDKEKMVEVISNLIDNAINYTKKGEVKVEANDLDGDVIISIKDSGIGVPEDKKKELFKRFSRLDNAKEVRPDGTGIGLYLAKSIVESHDGEIWFDSELGKGTTFFVKLGRGF